jgi:hypothetical protein
MFSVKSTVNTIDVNISGTRTTSNFNRLANMSRLLPSIPLCEGTVTPYIEPDIT